MTIRGKLWLEVVALFQNATKHGEVTKENCSLKTRNNIKSMRLHSIFDFNVFFFKVYFTFLRI